MKKALLLLFLLLLLCFNEIEHSFKDKTLLLEPKFLEGIITNKPKYTDDGETLTSNKNNNIKEDSKNKRPLRKNNIPRNHGSKMIPLVDRHWESLAPNVQVPSIPIWLKDYVDFHNTAISSIRNKTRTIHDYNYLIFSCVQGRTIYCYGTGNRQRTIAAGLLNAIVTGRLFLIHDNMPVHLSLVLSPNLIEWDAFFPKSATDGGDSNDPTQHELPWTPVLRLNRVPGHYPINTPSYFEPHADTSIMRYVAGGPGSLFSLMRSQEMTEYLQEQYNISSRYNIVIRAKKWIFNILFRPTDLLRNHVNKAQQSLGVISEKKNEGKDQRLFEFLPYVGVHVRMGNEGRKVLSRQDPVKEERYRISQLEPFYASGKVYRQQILSGNKTRDSPNDDVPMIIVADENEAKEVLKKYDPLHVRYMNSTVIHAGYFGLERLKAMVGSEFETNVIDSDNYDRTSLRAMLKNWTRIHGNDPPLLASYGLSEEESRQALMGLITMWSDILLLAQSSCIVESHSSFSVLAESLSVDNKNGRHPCFCRQIEGLLFPNKTDNNSCVDLLKNNDKG